MKKKLYLLLMFLIALTNINLIAQPSTFRGDYNSWGSSDSLTDRGVVRAIRIQETASGTRNFRKFGPSRGTKL